jgi:diaminopimelate epimerase
MTGPGRLRLTKHHGAGNDFLVADDPSGDLGLTGADAVVLCHRRTGIGADGLLVLGPGRAGAPVSMTLFNADGGEAEMSGNGLRCLAQAAVTAGRVAPPRFTVATGAGVLAVDYVPGEEPGSDWAEVDMGPVTLLEAPPAAPPATRARRVAVGNPHLVLLVDDPGPLDVGSLAASAAAGLAGGVNVEFISPRGDGALTLRVVERGVGETLACGTGTVAAAASARDWGLVGDRVTVHNPGGPLVVTLPGAPGEPARLAGPVRRVATLEVDPGLLS